jgi:hypothetical protein
VEVDAASTDTLTHNRGYPSDVSDEEWAFCAPYLTLMKADAPQWKYPLRELFNPNSETEKRVALRLGLWA